MKEELLAKWQRVVHRGIRWSASSSILLQVFSLVKAIVIGRVLGAEAIGLYALLQIASTFGARFSDLGLSNSVIHYRDLSRPQLGGLYIVNILGGAIVAMLVVGIGSWLYPGLSPFLPLIGVAIFVKSLAQQFQYLFQRDHDLKSVSLIEVVSIGLGELVTIVLLLQAFGLMAVVWGVFLTSIVYVLLFLLAGIRKYGAPLVFQASFSDFTKLFKWGFFQLGEGLLGYWGQRADRIILVSFLGLEFLGYYTLAIQLITKPYQFIGSISSRVFQPIYSSLSNKYEEINEIYLNNTKAIGSIVFPIYGFIALQAKEIIELLYGQGWELAVPLLQALCILGASKAIYVNIGSYLLGVGKPNLGFYINVYNSLLAIGVICLGVIVFGPIQGIFVYAIGVSFLALPADIYIRHIGTNMSPRPFLNSVFSIATITIIGILLALLISHTSGLNGWILQVLRIGVFTLVTGFLTYWSAYDASRKEFLSTMWFLTKRKS